MEESKKRRLEEGGGNGEFQSSAAKKTLKQLASLLTTDELQQLIADAASAHGDVASSLFAATSKSNQNRKVFVRGLDFDTSSETLNQIFSQYGKVEDCSVIRDKATGKSRGFGFITFAEMDAIVRALEEPSKLVDGRMAVCQLAVLGSRNNPQQQQQQQQQQHQQQQVQQGQYTDDILERKIFVANVHSSIPSETLLSYFAQYGDIQEGPIGFDKLTKKSRGYAIFVYKTVAGARSALAEPNKTIDGHQVFVKLAGDPKGKHAAQQQQQQQQQAQAGQLYQQQLYAQQQIMQPVVQGLAQVQQDGQTQQVYYSTGYTVAQPAPAYTATPGAVPGTQTLAPSQQAALYAYQTAAPVSTNGGYTVAASAVQQPYGVTQATMASPMVGTLQPQALYGVAAAPQTAAGQAGIYYNAATPQQQTAVSSVLSSSQALRSAGQGAVVLPAGYQAAPQQVGAAGAPGSYYATAAGAQPYGASAAGAVSLAYGNHGMGASAPRAP